jgi:hypothetical protein
MTAAPAALTPSALRDRLCALAARVDAAWAASPPEDHPHIAALALAEAQPHAGVTLDALLAMLAESDLPKQLDPSGAFGDPPFTLWWGQRVALDLYFWHQPEVAIHNHAFRGAFTVLLGYSLHLTYSFTTSPATTYDGLMFGALNAEHIDLLAPGQVTEILPGMAFIHQVCHLSSPCVSLVLRSLPHDPTHLDERIYDLLRPGCALLQSRHLTEAQHKRLALAHLLLRHGRHDALRALLDGAPDAEVAWALRQASHRAQDPAAGRALAGLLTQRPWYDAFLAAVDATDRAVLSWSTLTDEGHRLMALLLWLEPDPEARDRVLQRYPPGLTFDERLRVWVSDNGCADLLGVPLPYESALVLSALLDGQTDDEAAQRVAAHHGGAAPELFAPFVAQMRAVFTAHPVLGAALP